MAKKVFFLGSKPIGYFCFNNIIENRDFYDIEIVGLLTNNNTTLGSADLESLAIANNITVYNTLSEIVNLEVDYLISVQYHQILKKEHVNVARKLAINLHMAPLPEYRGCNQFTFAIIDGKKEFGTTLHIMNEGIDSGAILAERRFEIPEDIMVNDLYTLTFKASCELFSEEIKNVLEDKVNPIEQSHYLDHRTSSIHYRKEISEAKEIDLDWPKEKIWRHIRATSMPRFPPPFALINGVKINLTIEE